MWVEVFPDSGLGVAEGVESGVFAHSGAGEHDYAGGALEGFEQVGGQIAGAGNLDGFCATQDEPK